MSMEHNVQRMAQEARKAARQLAAVSIDTRNAALLAIADGIAANKSAATKKIVRIIFSKKI